MDYITDIILKFPAVLIALTFSAFGHSLFAYMMGDNTPKYTGRLSISPKVHLDPIGFLFLLLFGFGWSKPVMVNPNNFKNKKLGLAFYFIAGSITNIIVAIAFLWIFKIMILTNIGFDMLYLVMRYIVGVNIGYAAIQLIPIPPFSGYYFLKTFLPYKITMKLAIVEQYSMLIFMMLVLTNTTGYIIAPFYNIIYKFVFILAGV